MGTEMYKKDISTDLKSFLKKKSVFKKCHNFLKNGPMGSKMSLNDGKFTLDSINGLRIAINPKSGIL